MVNITLSISEDVYKEMKRHPEIKWSEVARKSIIEKANLLRGSIHSKDLLMRLPEETRERIAKTSDKDWKKFSKETRKKDWERVKFLTQVQHSKDKKA